MEESEFVKFEVIFQNGTTVAVVPKETRICDVQSALEIALSARYETGADRLLIDKRALSHEFFILSTGLLGEVLQKFVNYHIKAAFYGDYAHYTSKPLKDFVRESNRDSSFFFTETREEALEKLAEA